MTKLAVDKTTVKHRRELAMQARNMIASSMTIVEEDDDFEYDFLNWDGEEEI